MWIGRDAPGRASMGSQGSENQTTKQNDLSINERHLERGDVGHSPFAQSHRSFLELPIEFHQTGLCGDLEEAIIPKDYRASFRLITGASSLGMADGPASSGLAEKLELATEFHQAGRCGELKEMRTARYCRATFRLSNGTWSLGMSVLRRFVLVGRTYGDFRALRTLSSVSGLSNSITLCRVAVLYI
jgi:hypothetical protein